MGIIIRNRGKNTFFNDKRLSWAAIGMLSNILYVPSCRDYTIKEFMRMHSDGERAVRTALFELEWFGYLERTQVKNRQGHIIDYEYEFFVESKLPYKCDPVPKWKDRVSSMATHVKIVNGTEAF